MSYLYLKHRNIDRNVKLQLVNILNTREQTNRKTCQGFSASAKTNVDCVDAET